MSLTFYYAPYSTASTVHWTLEELGLPYEAIAVNLADESDKRRQLGTLNPNRKVPVLVHDGLVLFESAAIQIYLGETFGVSQGLYPAPGPGRGEALKWLVWTNVTLGEAASRWMRAREKGDHVATAEAQRDLDHGLRILDEALKDRRHLLGDGVSIVDFHLASFIQWLRGGGGVDLSALSRLVAWADRMDARPANRKLMAAEAS